MLRKLRSRARQPILPFEASLYRVIFLQIADRLPADEAAQLRRAFGMELERLGVVS